jgi:hypothetical protein
VDTAAYDQLLTEALAVGDKENDGSALRADVAETYRDFADQLTLITLQAPGKLGPTLTDWASASTEVARFVAGTQPRAGLVIDYGPAHKRWEAARKTAEGICGHRLPDLDQ